MNRQILFLTLIIFSFTQAFSQSGKTENIVIVTLDGMRWQEVFGGVDSVLLNNPKYTRNSKQLREKYWAADAEQRRQVLFPFLWKNIAVNGQLHGNRKYGNYMNVSNPYQFSYPGYNELFTGYPDTAVNSNDKIPNKNETVLEFINKQKGFKGKVAVFSSWDCFPYIFNKWRSGIYVNADVDTFHFNTPQFKMLNDLQFLTTKPVGVRPDLLTYIAAKEYLNEFQPRVLYIAFDETDDFAHGGQYDQYIASANAADAMIADLWSTLQAHPKYRNKTTLLITCDHGRGDLNKDEWRDHGKDVKESGEIWLAVVGPDTKALGEMKTKGQLYQKQVATTIAALLGLKFKPGHAVPEAIGVVVGR